MGALDAAWPQGCLAGKPVARPRPRPSPHTQQPKPSYYQKHRAPRSGHPLAHLDRPLPQLGCYGGLVQRALRLAAGRGRLRRGARGRARRGLVRGHKVAVCAQLRPAGGRRHAG
jgi:hypothetical protein